MFPQFAFITDTEVVNIVQTRLPQPPASRCPRVSCVSKTLDVPLTAGAFVCSAEVKRLA